jgi:hypothetical protein
MYYYQPPPYNICNNNIRDCRDVINGGGVYPFYENQIDRYNMPYYYPVYNRGNQTVTSSPIAYRGVSNTVVTGNTTVLDGMKNTYTTLLTPGISVLVLDPLKLRIDTAGSYNISLFGEFTGTGSSTLALKVVGDASKSLILRVTDNSRTHINGQLDFVSQSQITFESLIASAHTLKYMSIDISSI